MQKIEHVISEDRATSNMTWVGKNNQHKGGNNQ